MKIYGAVRTAIYWALTALVIVFIATLAEIETLRYFIGGLMIFYGVEEIAHTAIKHKKHYSIHSLYWNIIEVLIGLTMIVFVETGDEEVTYAVVCVGWAIWSILRETRELVEVTHELKENKLTICRIVGVINILESLIVIALSLTMIIEPGEHHAKMHLYLLSAELFTKVLFPILNYIAEHLEERKKAKAEKKLAAEPPATEESQELPATEDAQAEPAPQEEQEPSATQEEQATPPDTPQTTE